MTQSSSNQAPTLVKLTANDFFASKIEITADFLPYASLSLQQYGWSLLRSFSITNLASETLHDVAIVFSAKPAVFQEKTFFVSEIKPQEKLTISSEVNLPIDYDFIKVVSEPTVVDINVAVKVNDTVALNSPFKTTALPMDQWQGSQFYPELICSYVTPNAPFVNKLLSIAAQNLVKNTKGAAMDGYASNREGVLAQIAAIYKAVVSQNINYVLPPASFAKQGQRIRLADNIAEFRIGTCLDTTILFASILEQAGLNPVIIMLHSHAFVGCHLVKRSFQTMPLDDVQQIRKYVDLDEFCLVETTLSCSEASFAEAESAAYKHLNTDEFEYAVDVARARASDILPLAMGGDSNGGSLSNEEHPTNNPVNEKTRSLAADIDVEKYINATHDNDRMSHWQQKLLDLSLRNRLLNTRPSKQVVDLSNSDFANLEDLLSCGKIIRVKSFEEVLSAAELEKLDAEQGLNKNEFFKELFSKDAFKGMLFASLPKKVLVKNLTAIYRQARTDLDDGGVNTAFIAMGFLKWKERESDTTYYKAPLILIPIKLIKESALGNFSVQRIDNEPIINVTLLEMLKRQFKLEIGSNYEGFMIRDEHGLDVQKILQLFRKLVVEMKDWEVIEGASLGIFSFGKFIMWTDMTERAEALRSNPLVNHLVQGGGYYDDGISVPDPATVVNNINLEEFFCPMSADSSQLAAVAYSAAGKSFVLHGPPGTGKSQTITNIIAHNLALGRRVLFVSEKKAALDVVYKRLSSVGLAPFCLELHSNKSGKTDVLKQFKDILEYIDKGYPAEWEQTVSTMSEIRANLNEYVATLHHVYPNGFSAHDCFAIVLDSKYKASRLVDFKDILEQSQEQYKKLLVHIDEFVTNYSLASAQAKAALEYFSGMIWNPMVEREWEDATRQLLERTSALQALLPGVSELLGVDFSESNLQQLEQMSLLLAEFSNNARVLTSGLFSDDVIKGRTELIRYVDLLLEIGALEKKLSEFNLSELDKISWDGIEGQLADNDKKWFVGKYFANKRLLGELKQIRRIGATKLTVESLKAAIPDLKRYLAQAALKKDLSVSCGPLLEKLKQGDSLEQLKEKLAALDKCMGYINECSQAPVFVSAICGALANSENKLWIDFASTANVQKGLSEAVAGLLAALLEYKAYSSTVSEMTEPHKLQKVLHDALENKGELRNALIYFAAKRGMEQNGLSAFVSIVKEAPEKLGGLRDMFVTEYAQLMLEEILASSPLMAGFSGPTQNEQIVKFCDYDDRYIELSKYVAVAMLASRLPRLKNSLDGVAAKTELGLLRRECEKKSRQLPVRQLLARIPELLPSIKPCFLMSPLSVAQYLPSDAAQFDLVVFDEASQIPVWDAIGVIARGKQLIVVGDPKQMPPTSFFQKTDTTEEMEISEDAEITEDMESILDECLASGIHSTHLNWHYRSRHEELISFSNHHYYNDKLMTFPAASTEENLGVHFRFVEGGVYDRRSSRTNIKEAEALVNYIFELFDGFGDKPRSIGVVTFSQAQKDLIEDLIDKRRAENPQYEKYFLEDSDEPLFVKNLENVQGDERDIILFSICYANDKDGKFSMNFGPLNRAGGERRLNVAITRSKRMVVVFASIHGYNIDTNRTAAVGAAHLRSFLEYAEKGATFATNRREQSAIVEGLSNEVAEFIKANGYQVERGVGLSGYRVDIAVVHPQKPEVFMAGIESDGKAYANQRTARDRDHIRSSVMSSLGWALRREWSMDWVYDRPRAEKALLEFLKNAEQGKCKNQTGKTLFPKITFSKKSNDSSENGAHAANSQAVPYKVWNPDKRLRMTKERFYEPESCSIITRQIMELVAEEGPITGNLINKRISDAWGFTQIGDRIEKIIGSCIPLNLFREYTEQGIVYWANENQNPKTISYYRVPATKGDELPRTIENIILEELVVAMQEIYRDYKTTDKEIIYKLALKPFGYHLATDKVRPYLDRAWEKAFDE